MKYLAAIILMSFLGLAFLGLMPMDHSTHHAAGEQSSCPIAALLSVICSADAATMTVIHVSALQSFVNAPLSTSLALVALMLAALVVFLILYKRRDMHVPAVFGFKRQKFSYGHAVPLEKERSWLSMFENSPSFA